MGPFFSPFLKELVSLLKIDGEIIRNIPALCDSTEFHIDDPSIIIEEGDYFERTLSNGAKEYYRVIERGFFESSLGIPAHYQTQVAKVNKSEVQSTLAENQLRGKNMKAQTNKLFISHSSNDKAYMKAFVELLEDIGMPDGTIVCTSVPGHGIPGGARIYDWLREQFTSCNLRVVFALSKNYYDSPASLNEMGAAWVTKATDTLLLLPGFDFKDIKGCIDPTEVGIRLEGDDEELKHRLNELKNTLISEHSLPSITDTRWERHRNDFIKKVHDISEEEKATTTDSAPDKSEDYAPLSTSNMGLPAHIPVESAFLIIYAASDCKGEILRVKSLSKTEISTAGKNFVKDSSAREIARWQEALDSLVTWKCVKSIGKNGQVFSVTDVGYSVANMLTDFIEIDTNKDPLEQLKEFRTKKH